MKRHNIHAQHQNINREMQEIVTFFSQSKFVKFHKLLVQIKFTFFYLHQSSSSSSSASSSSSLVPSDGSVFEYAKTVQSPFSVCPLFVGTLSSSLE